MIFEWDEAKSRANARDRSLPFDLAVAMFDDVTMEAFDARRDYGEVRTKALGGVGGLCLVCVYTDRGDVRRIISLRIANRKERDDYRKAL
ncbi:MAG: BrnT family toxin [Pseudomonadota bacterium]|nr:BrnT family toxin [Pseudomonadota bacterium]